MDKQKIIQSFQSIEGWLSIHEGLLLYCLAKEGEGEGVVVEIGSWKGKSTVCLGLGLKAAKRNDLIYAIDPHEGKINVSKKRITKTTYDDFLFSIRKNNIKDVVKPIVSTSEGAVRHWKKDIRLLFIDGLHDYKHTKEDITLWSPFLSKESVVAFHDCFCGEVGVFKAATEFWTEATIVDIGTVGSILYFCIGKPTVVTNIRVHVKKIFVQLAWAVYRQSFPKIFQILFIHRLIRIFLVTKYTRMVY